MLSLIVALLGLALIVAGVFALINSSIVFGIILIIVGIVLLGARGGGYVL